MKHTEKGLFGENLACDYLQKQDFEIIKRNFRYKKGEIDVICKKENTLIFVEVKYRTSDAFGMPENSVNATKKKIFLRTANEYIFQEDWQNDIRFDIIAILHKSNQEPEIMHFEDAFY